MVVELCCCARCLSGRIGPLLLLIWLATNGGDGRYGGGEGGGIGTMIYGEWLPSQVQVSGQAVRGKAGLSWQDT